MEAQHQKTVLKCSHRKGGAQHPPGCPLLAFRAGCPSPEFVITRGRHPLRCGDNILPLMGVLILLICPTGVHLGPHLGVQARSWSESPAGPTWRSGGHGTLLTLL